MLQSEAKFATGTINDPPPFNGTSAKKQLGPVIITVPPCVQESLTVMPNSKFNWRPRHTHSGLNTIVGGWLTVNPIHAEFEQPVFVSVTTTVTVPFACGVKLTHNALTMLPSGKVHTAERFSSVEHGVTQRFIVPFVQVVVLPETQKQGRVDSLTVTD